MKIGILTFHWATNYGAILQAYALQTYLQEKGHEVSIINYHPKNFKKSFVNSIATPRVWLLKARLQDYLKEIQLKKFREKHLKETKIYESLENLKSNPPELDVYICGSDQIWNPSFLLHGEGKLTPAYFMDFGSTNIKRIAYAVSFGCEVYPQEAAVFARKYMASFDAISVREDSGVKIVNSFGSSAQKLPDPTILLKNSQYSFNGTPKIRKGKRAFIYVLRNEDNGVKNIKRFLKKEYKIIDSSARTIPFSLEQWVQEVQSASLVLTNSYHGMIFSLIFHVPFFVVLAKGTSAGMNDRFRTLLSYLGLEDRIVNGFRENKTGLKELETKNIDWNKIDVKMNSLKKETDKYFYNNLCK